MPGKASRIVSEQPSDSLTTSRKSFWGQFKWIFAMVLLGAIPRLNFLIKTDFGIESDEAIVGLMARHILEGEGVPVFYYGQNYLGSLEALLVSASFALFGESNASLKLVPFLCSLVFIVVSYFLTKQYGGERAARLSSLLVAVPPQALMIWSLKARGGFIELLIIGSISLLLTTWAVKNTSTFKLAAIGLVLGLGWWVNNQIVFYMAAVALVLGALLLCREGIWSLLGGGATILFFFLLGGYPFWYANIVEQPRFSSFQTLFGGSKESLMTNGGTSLLNAFSRFNREVFTPQLQGFWEESLPILLGSRRFWSVEDNFPGATTLALVTYGAALALYLLFWVMSLMRRDRSRVQKVKPAPFSLPLVFLICTVSIFALSSFGWLSQAPRYLLPVYSVLFLVVGVGCCGFVTGLGNFLGGLVAFSALFINLSSNFFEISSKDWSIGLVTPGEPFVYQGERVQRDHTELYSWLNKQGYGHVITDYWIGYRMAFETGEAVTFSRFSREGPIRIPQYESDRGEYEEDVYLLVNAQAETVKRELSARGFSFRENLVGGYTILDWIVPVSWRGEPISLDESYLSTEFNSDGINQLVDGDPGTRWSSKASQAPEMEVVLNFEEPIDISGLDIDMGFWPHDFPVRLAIDLMDEEGQWCNNFDSKGMDVFSEWRRLWQFYFRPQRVRAVRLRQLGKHNVFDWSVAELVVYGTEEGNSEGSVEYSSLDFKEQLEEQILKLQQEQGQDSTGGLILEEQR